MKERTLHEIKYFKPRRFPVNGRPLPEERAGRHLSKKDSEYLLSGKVIVEEKMDGSPVSFIAGGKYRIFAEDLKARHSLYYKVPGRYAIFDIFDYSRNLFVFPEEKIELALAVRKGSLRVDGNIASSFFPVPTIESGVFSSPEELVLLAGTSAYAINAETGGRGMMEGVVVKPYRDLYPEEQMRGKYVRPEFEDEISTHYLRMPYSGNEINPGIGLVLHCSPGSKNGALSP